MMELEEMDTDFDCPNPECRAASMTELLHEWTADYDIWRCPYCFEQLFYEGKEDRKFYF